jgi:hypothetical protein
MSQKQTQKVVNTFIKGLITEAGELTFPPDASVDELNCDLRRDGSRRRRLGVSVESSNVLSTFTISDSDVTSNNNWLNVGGDSSIEFLVVQVGATLRFYDKAATPFSGDEVTQSVSLIPYEVAGAGGAASTKVQCASINGNLVVASSAIDTVVISRDNSTGTLTVSQINFKVRDFEWQGDTDTYTSSTGSPSIGRQYDTKNTGWVGTKGDAARTAFGSYPPLTHPWYSGKDSDGNFSKTEWENVYAGSSLTGRGYFILDFFNKGRHAASGIAGSSLDESEGSRFSTVASFGGRVFYAGLNSGKNGGSILFSRLIEQDSDFGKCHQINDPTSEDLSDLLDTDGGVIKIAGAFGIRKLFTLGAVLMVFADNGVWAITGVDGVFKATEFSIKKITEVGILSAESFVSADGVPLWWSKFGIHAMQFDKVTGDPSEQNISLGTIQTYWDSIDQDSKLKVIVGYDRNNRRVFWGWPNVDEVIEGKINNVLVMDLALQAFYPWEIKDEASNTSHVFGFSYYEGFGSDLTTVGVVDSVGNNVITSGGDDVIIDTISPIGTGSPSIITLIRDGTTNKMTLGGFLSDTFLDWGSVNYTSYAEAGYDFLGDLMLQKNSPYLATYMRVTETGWEGDETDGYDMLNSSSLLVSSYWDFSTTSSTTPQQAYRFSRVPVVDVSEFSYDKTVITTRLKLRGRGRSMRLRFESEEGKDFILLGYGLIGAANGRY